MQMFCYFLIKVLQKKRLLKNNPVFPCHICQRNISHTGSDLLLQKQRGRKRPDIRSKCNFVLCTQVSIKAQLQYYQQKETNRKIAPLPPQTVTANMVFALNCHR